MRKPTNLLITDACLQGIGGVSMSSGCAWRFDLRPFKIKDNNKLEFLAAVVGVLQAHKDNEIPQLGNILALTDNSAGCITIIFIPTANPSMSKLQQNWP